MSLWIIPHPSVWTHQSVPQKQQGKNKKLDGWHTLSELGMTGCLQTSGVLTVQSVCVCVCVCVCVRACVRACVECFLWVCGHCVSGYFSSVCILFVQIHFLSCWIRCVCMCVFICQVTFVCVCVCVVRFVCMDACMLVGFFFFLSQMYPSVFTYSCVCAPVFE